MFGPDIPQGCITYCHDCIPIADWQRGIPYSHGNQYSSAYIHLYAHAVVDFDSHVDADAEAHILSHA